MSQAEERAGAKALRQESVGMFEDQQERASVAGKD